MAVLAFKYRGGNAQLEAFAEGLSEEIVTGLSRFSYLRFIAHSSTMRFTQEHINVRTAGKDSAHATSWKVVFARRDRDCASQCNLPMQPLALISLCSH